jgi:hypothetical protein
LHTARIITGAAVAFAIAAFVACSDDTTSSAPATVDGGGTSSSGGSSGTDGDGATSGDSSTTGDSATPTGKTSVDAEINGVTQTLTRAQFGTENDDAGKPRVHVEAHLGGAPECPSSDPDAAAGAQPQYTLVVSNIPKGNAGESFTKAGNGVTAAYFDFVGDQLDTKPLTQATAVKVTIVATSSATFELDVEATFPEGTAKGRISAEYCQSLSL